MLQSLSVTGGRVDYEFLMSASEESGALILDIAGIAEHSSEVVVEKTNDIPVITNINTQARNIVLTLRLTAADVEAKRRQMRSVFPKGKEVILTFVTDHTTQKISGTVESVENPIFTDQSIITISIMCPDPEFVSETFSEVFTNFGEINYDGENPVGVFITLGNVHNQTADFTVGNASTSESMTFDLTQLEALVGELSETDTIIVSSRSTKKCVLMRNGQETNIFSAIRIPFRWIKLVPGENELVVTPSVGTTISISYSKAYEGL